MPPPLSRNRDALGKALLLFRWLVDSTEDSTRCDWGVRELSASLKIPVATLHRLLSALVRHGMLKRSRDGGRYQIGPELYRLALKLSSSPGIQHAALPIMQELVTECDENAFLGLYDASRLEMMFVAGVKSNHPLSYAQPLHEWIPVYAGASGLAIMAHLPESERREIARRTGLAPVTRNTITDPELLGKELARVRQRGYALARGQRNLGTVGLAAPIWGPDGRVIGSLILAMPESRFDRRAEKRLAELVVRHARQLTERIGGRVEPPGVGAASR